MLPIETDPDNTVIEVLDPRLGQILGERYRLVHQLAAGGFGAVYIATDLTTEADVAVKLVHAKHAKDALIAARFKRETEALSSLSDSHTVAAIDAGEADDGTPYLVMELLSGESLYEHYKGRGVLRWQRVVHIARGVCSSLAEAHALGIVHRDLKPANIHLERRGSDPDYAKVLDFGIAKVIESSVLDNAELTHTGQMVGTCDYMAPEQMTGMATPQSDLFTLGVVMYEMIVGARPYGDVKGPPALLAAVLDGPPPAIPNVPPILSQIILRCIDADPQRRYQSASELSAALAPLESEDAPTVMTPGPRLNALSWLKPGLNSTIPGIVAIRSIRPSAIAVGSKFDAHLRISNDPKPDPFAESVTTATGLSNYRSTSWRAVVVALAVAMLIIAIGLLL